MARLPQLLTVAVTSNSQEYELSCDYLPTLIGGSWWH